MGLLQASLKKFAGLKEEQDEQNNLEMFKTYIKMFKDNKEGGYIYRKFESGSKGIGYVENGNWHGYSEFFYSNGNIYKGNKEHG